MKKKDVFTTHIFKKEKPSSQKTIKNADQAATIKEILEGIEITKEISGSDEIFLNVKWGGSWTEEELTDALNSDKEDSPVKTEQSSQSFIVRLPLFLNKKDGGSITTSELLVDKNIETLLDDMNFGDVEQAVLSDFGGEILLEVKILAEEPVGHVLVWLKYDDVKRVHDWLRCWLANHF